MKNQDEKIVLATDPDLVEYRTNIEGWVGKDGFFYGKNKERAIEAQITHRKCEKGHIYSKYAWCDTCRAAKLLEEYRQMPYEDWDEETPLVLHYDDKYFFNKEDVEEYMDEHDLNPEDLNLVICEPNYLWEIHPDDHWDDVLPMDFDFEEVASQKLQSKINELNELILEHDPVSWKPGKYRTSIKLQNK